MHRKSYRATLAARRPSVPAAGHVGGPRALRRAVVEALEGRALLAGDLPVVTATAIDADASEVNRDPGVVRVSRTGPTTQPLVVDVDLQPSVGTYPADDTEKVLEQDFDATNVSQLLTTTIPAGRSYVDLVLTPRADLRTEGDQTITVRIDGDPFAPRYAHDFEAGAVVRVADRPSPQTITMGVVNASASEAGDRPAVLLFRRTGDLSQRTVLPLARTGAFGREGSQGQQTDMVFGGPRSVTFNPGDAEATVFFAPLADDEVEGTETATVTPQPFHTVAVAGEAAATLTVEDGPVYPSVTLTPSADAWVGAGGEAGQNFGSGTRLLLRPDADGRREAYLRFDVSSVPSVAEARLEYLSLSHRADRGTGLFGVYGVPDAEWTEAGVTYANRPLEPLSAVNSGAVFSDGPGTPAWGQTTVSEYVQRQRLLGATAVTFRLVPEMMDGVSTPPAFGELFSRESDSPPRLVIRPVADLDTNVLDVSHRDLTVAEGGTARAYASTWDASAWSPVSVWKVPGGDPDISADVTLIRFAGRADANVARPVTFTAAADADGAYGTATFVVSINGVGRVVTVREQDTGANGPGPGDAFVVPVTSDGFAENGGSAGGGLAGSLKVRNTETDAGEQESFVHLDLTALPAADQIGGARLRLYGGAGAVPTAAAALTAAAAAEPVAVSAYATAASEWYWDESALTWAGRPAAVGGAVATRAVGAGGWYEFDVGGLVRAGRAAGARSVSVALKGAAAGGTSAVFASDEAAANRPVLVVTKGAPPTSPPPPVVVPPPPASTVSVRAAADAYVQDGSSAGANFGGSGELQARLSSYPGNWRESYLRFDLTQIAAADQITSAKVRVYGRLSAAGSVTVGLFPVANNGWTEGSLSWSNKPAAAAAALGTAALSSTANGWHEYDVTGYLKQQKAAGAASVSLALKATNYTSPHAVFASDEAAANRPELRVTQQAGAVVPPPPPAGAPARLSGTVIGTAGSYNGNGNTAAKALDGSPTTYFDAPAAAASGAWVGLDLGSAKAITQVRYAPRDAWAGRMVGGRFQASNSATFASGVVDLHTVTTAPAAGTLTTVPTAATGGFRYVRYLAPANSYGNVAEAQFFGPDAPGGTVPPVVSPPPPPAGVPAKLAGATIGTSGSYNNNGNTAARALDGSPTTYFDAPAATGAWIGLDLGSARKVTQVRFAPRAGWAGRMVGGRFQASNSATFASGVVDLHAVSAAPAGGVLTTAGVNPAGTSYRYVRYLSPAGSYGNVAEVQFFGT